MGKKNTIYIRADANERIGTGHVMRCLSIGEAIRKQGADAIFLAADARTEELVKSQGFSAVCLDSVWNDLEKELDRIVSWIWQNNVSVLLIDSYYVTPHYLDTLRQYTRLVYIDDLNAFPYPVDLLISYAVYARPSDYEEYNNEEYNNEEYNNEEYNNEEYNNKEYNYEVLDDKKTGRTCQQTKKQQPRLLLGSRYIPLKSRFCHLPERKISESVKNILVLTGGTDPYHVALEFVKYLAETNHYKTQQFHIICGKYNPDYDKLCRLASALTNVKIHYNVDGMADFMLAVDLAVTAGGTTTYELCACGTPSVCYILADNQIQNAREMAEKGLMLFGGDVREKGWLAEIMRQLEYLSGAPALRKEMSEKMQKLVDGKGAGRIAEAICSLTEPESGKEDSSEGICQHTNRTKQADKDKNKDKAKEERIHKNV